MKYQPRANRGDWARRNRLRSLGLLTALWAFASPGPLAQNCHAQTNTTQAVLRISVRVAPVVMLPPPERSESDAGAGVTYSLPRTPPAMTVTEETRPLPLRHAATLPAGVSREGAHLKTLTVVAR